MSQDSGVRPGLAAAIRGAFTEEWWGELAELVKGAVRGQQVEFDCPECGFRKKVTVEVRDLPRVIQAAKELLEQAEGKPGTVDAEESGLTLVVERSWPGAGDSGSDGLPPAA